MRAPGYVLAFFRAIILIIIMGLFILLYAATIPLRGNTNERAFRLRRRYVIIAAWFLGIKWEKSGEVTEKPALYISNHRTLVDPVIVSVFLDAFVIAKAEVGSMPLLNKGAELTGIIYVQRENKESRNETREKMKEMIRGGQNVLVYPEGTVSGNKTTIEFKKGTFIEAAKDGFKVVPIALEYKTARDHWVKISLFKQYFKQFSKWRTYAKIKFGPVLSSDDGLELHQMTRDWIDKSLIEMQKGWSTAFPTLE